MTEAPHNETHLTASRSGKHKERDLTAKLKKASKATRAGEPINSTGKLSKRRTKPGGRSGKKRNSAKQQEAEHHRKANEYLLEAWKLLYRG